MKIILLIIILIHTNVSLSGATDNETLKYYVSKSDLIVSGKVQLVAPIMSSEGGTTNSYNFSYQISEVIHGAQKLKGCTIHVNFQSFSRSTILIKNDSEYILFLKKRLTNKHWTLADLWFGIQPTNDFMQEGLTQMIIKSQSKSQ